MDNEAKTNSPTVKVFGSCVKDEGDKEGRGSSVTGLLVLFAGVILLFNYAGEVSWEIWHYIWPFWPVLLVLAGVSILLGDGGAARLVVFLLAFVIFSMIIVYGLEHTGSALTKYVPRDFIEFTNNTIKELKL